MSHITYSPTYSVSNFLPHGSSFTIALAIVCALSLIYSAWMTSVMITEASSHVSEARAQRVALTERLSSRSQIHSSVPMSQIDVASVRSRVTPTRSTDARTSRTATPIAASGGNPSPDEDAIVLAAAPQEHQWNEPSLEPDAHQENGPSSESDTHQEEEHEDSAAVIHSEPTETEENVHNVLIAQAPSTSNNSLRGMNLYVNPNSKAKNQADEWRSSRPQDAQQMDKIASQPETFWVGDWNADVEQEVRDWTQGAQSQGAVPVFVLYNVPGRDCGSYSAGGSNGHGAYINWVERVLSGIGSAPAVIILEPDALAGMDCLSQEGQDARVQMIREAVDMITSRGSIALYIDAGHSSWQTPDEIANRLMRAGIEKAEGFALNVSNYQPTANEVSYGEAISRLTNGKHFVVDTSRNGNGPDANNEWCNPNGRALGEKPTTDTGHSLVDAYLWIKIPGESDGTCNGGPAAGQWWSEYALGMAQRANW